MTGTDVNKNEVLVFESALFPASKASDPDLSEDEWGKACLRYILDAIEAPSIRDTGVEITSDDGSGFFALVESLDSHVWIHLAWYPATPGRTRDLWTVQIYRAWSLRLWLGGLLRKILRREDEGESVNCVIAAVTDLLRARSEEFSDVRVCAWKELDTPAESKG